MTPSPVATHAAQPRTIGLAPGRLVEDRVASTLKRVLDVHAWARLRLVVDVCVLFLASCFALFAAPTQSTGANRWLAAAFPIAVLMIMHARSSPDSRLNGSLLDVVAYVLGVVSLATMLTIAAYSVAAGVHPLGLALRLWLFASVYLGVARAVLLSVRRHALAAEAYATPTLIIGDGVVGARLVNRLVQEPRLGLRPVGFLDYKPMPRADGATDSLVPVLGGPDDLGKAIEHTGARQVIIAFSTEPDRLLVERVRDCQRLGVEVSVVPRLYESINHRAALDYIGGVPLLSLRSIDPHGRQFAVKHALDRGLALIALIAFFPTLVALAFAVRVTSPGPILFRQRRVGRDGRTFDLLKFRTMREPTCADPFELPKGSAPGGVEGQDRRTCVGHWIRGTSLDELPQLINVVRGDMSLVGPRPERPEYVERFTTEVDGYVDRHRVKSGITGWAQVRGLRGQTSISERVEWDNYYIQNWSLSLDMRILALTAVEVLRARGRG